MTSYPTDVTQTEERLARERLAALADKLKHEGVLRAPEWRQAFLSTWRHPYVPAYYPSTDRPPVLCVDPTHRADWLDAVYSDQTLVTKVQPMPLSRAFQPATWWMYTSSSTLPSLVLRMLETLDVRDGHTVLEIGAGSGYNCALLCQRLGSARVVSVDIDPELVDLATERLAANGYTPTLAVTDGAEGYPACAPYDRIIATCAVRTIPPAWLEQAAPGAVILTDVHGKDPLGAALVRLTVSPDGTASGRFVPHWAGFMWIRPALGPNAPRSHTWGADEPIRSTTELDPSPLLRPQDSLGFLTQWQLPDVHRSLGTTEHGRPALCLWAEDDSEAFVETSATDGRYRVAETGPRRLWRTVEQTHELWQAPAAPASSDSA